MRRRILLALLVLPLPAVAQPAEARRRRTRHATVPSRPTPPRPPVPEIDPAPRAGTAPVPDRRFPSAEQAAQPETRLRPVVPTARNPTSGASFTDRDGVPPEIGQRGAGAAGFRPEPGVSLTLPIR